MLNRLKYGINYDLHFRKGKYYTSVNAPSDIALFYADKPYRRSTGSSDESVANQKVAIILKATHADFDKKRLELVPFVEALRPYFEQSGINVSAWHINGFIAHEFYGEDTLLWQMTHGEYEGFKQPSLNLGDISLLPTPANDPIHKMKREAEYQAANDTESDPHSGHPLNFSGWQVNSEEYVANNYFALSELVTKLEYAVPKQAIQYLSSEEMCILDKPTKPVKTDIKRFIKVLQDRKFNKTHLAKVMLENFNDILTEPQV